MLKGKAIETLTLSPALAFVFGEHSDGSAFDRMICLALDRCVGIDKIFQEHQHENVLPGPASLDLQRQVFEYLELQQTLQKLSAKKLNRKLFNLTKKAHDLFHISELASEINPKRIWCMPQEVRCGILATNSKRSIGWLCILNSPRRWVASCETDGFTERRNNFLASCFRAKVL